MKPALNPWTTRRLATTAMVLALGALVGTAAWMRQQRPGASASRSPQSSSSPLLREGRLHPLPPDPREDSVSLPIDTPKAIPPAETAGQFPGAFPIATYKDEVKERNGAFGYRGNGYLLTADRDGISSALPRKLRDGRRPSLQLALGEIRVGDQLLASGGPAAPELRATDRTLAYTRGPVEERYVLRKGSFEQDFVLHELPEGRGDIVIRTSVRTNLDAPTEGTHAPTLTFAGDGKAAITVSDAVAVDARGRKLPLELAYAQGEIRMTVPAAWVSEAALPIVVDPLVGGAILVDPLSSSPTERLDVAYCSSTNEWLVIWEDVFGATSDDILGQRISASGSLVGSPFLVGDSGASDTQPALAYSVAANKSLAVWKNYATGGMVGVFIQPDGSVPGPLFAIANPAGSNDQAAVAADDLGGWYVVFRNHESGMSTGRGCLVSSTGVVTAGIDPSPVASGIAWPRVAFANHEYMVNWSESLSTMVRRVSPSGTFLTPATLVQDSEGANAGNIAASGNQFLITWSAGSQQKLRGRFANADGAAAITFPAASFDITSPVAYYPAAAYSSTSAEWYVIHQSSAFPSSTNGSRVSPAGLASAEDLIATPTSTYHPRLAWNSATNEMLIVYQSTATDPPQIFAQRFAMSNLPPPVPGSLRATPGNSQVTLQWNSSATASSYNVKRATTSGGPYTVIAAGVATTGFIDTGLTNGTTYYYVVSATGSAGESANSNQVQVTPGPLSAQVLLVVGNTLLGTGDTAIESRLRALGYTPVVRTDSVSTTGDATGKALIIVSSTVGSGSVNTKFRTVPVPVIS